MLENGMNFTDLCISSLCCSWRGMQQGRKNFLKTSHREGQAGKGELPAPAWEL